MVDWQLVSAARQERLANYQDPDSLANGYVMVPRGFKPGHSIGLIDQATGLGFQVTIPPGCTHGHSFRVVPPSARQSSEADPGGDRTQSGLAPPLCHGMERKDAADDTHQVTAPSNRVPEGIVYGPQPASAWTSFLNGPLRATLGSLRNVGTKMNLAVAQNRSDQDTEALSAAPKSSSQSSTSPGKHCRKGVPAQRVRLGKQSSL